jgi:LysR family transcriptional regulator, carnitine catabolism transcriptional activator
LAITLGRMRSFVVLAETGSFNRTSEIVGRSQPAVTAQIRTLEETLGVPLFYRRTRSVTLTPEGDVLYARISRLLRELDDLLDDFRKVTSLESGEVRVGATPTLAGYMFPEIIRSYREKYPGIRVHFTDEPTTRLERMVVDRELDFYFGPKPSLSSGLAFRVVAHDEYVVVVPKSHELAKSRKIKIEKLTKYPILLMRRNTTVRKEIDDFFSKKDLHIEPTEEVSSHFTLGGLVEAGCGITLLPNSALPLAAHPGILAVRFSDAKFFRILGIATRTDYRTAPAAKEFMKMMTPLVKKSCPRSD